MSHLNYEDFEAECFDYLKNAQALLQRDYNIDGYKNWFYNQSTGLLTFSTGDTQINFSYFEVGTYSQTSNTWKWAWDNEYTTEKIKAPSLAIRELGISSGFMKLTEGYFPCEVVDAWGFAAIAAKLTNGIGVYRPVSDHLLIFMVLTQFVDREAAENIKNKFISCGTHDYQRRAFVCQHLNKEMKTGFHEAFEATLGMELYEDDDLEAWCDECEQQRLDEGEWNDRSMAFADIKLVCENCYFEMKDFNLS